MSVKMVDWVLLVGSVTGHMGEGIGIAPPADSCVIPWVSDTCHLALQVISNLTTMVPSFSPSVRGWNFLKPSFIHTLGLFGFWTLCNVTFRKEQVRGTASVPVFR